MLEYVGIFVIVYCIVLVFIFVAYMFFRLLYMFGSWMDRIEMEIEDEWESKQAMKNAERGLSKGEREEWLKGK